VSEADEEAEIAASLAGVLEPATGWRDISIERLVRVSGGASRDTWCFDAALPSGVRHPLILQRTRSLVVDAWVDTATEARLVQAAREAGVPVPDLITWSADPEPLGLPFLITQRIEGETIPQRILRSERYAAARERLARQYGAALGQIHRIPLDAVEGLEDQDPLAHYASVLAGIDEPHPALELGLRWLAANRPPAAERVVVHGDFRNGNGIVDEGGLRAIIDSYEQIIAGYESVTDRTVDRDVLRWWQVMGSVRWAAICMMQGATHWTGHRRSLELAVTGRRVAEAEFDLMLLLP
jgi:aminoglycoside phosphotransferase (APT) family kinase protein